MDVLALDSGGPAFAFGRRGITFSSRWTSGELYEILFIIQDVRRNSFARGSAFTETGSQVRGRDTMTCRYQRSPQGFSRVEKTYHLRIRPLWPCHPNLECREASLGGTLRRHAG